MAGEADPKVPPAGTGDNPPAGPGTPPPAGTQQAGDPPPGPAPEGKIEDLPSWAQQVVRELRSENAKHRKAKTDADSTAQVAADQAAKEQGKWKELAEKYEPDAKNAAQYRQFFEERLTAVSAKVPENLKPLIPDLVDPLAKLTWIEKALESGLFASKPAPVTDARTPTPDTLPGDKAVLEATRNEFAAIYGVDPRYVPGFGQ